MEESISMRSTTASRIFARSYFWNTKTAGLFYDDSDLLYARACEREDGNGAAREENELRTIVLEPRGLEKKEHSYLPVSDVFASSFLATNSSSSASSI